MDNKKADSVLKPSRPLQKERLRRVHLNWGLPPQTPKQNKRSMKGDSLTAELTWFHVFKAMLDIFEKSGISERQVKTELRWLLRPTIGTYRVIPPLYD